jgi:hypothetical protein
VSYKAARRSLVIDHALQIGKQIRPALRLIEHGAVFEACEKTARVLHGEGALDRVFERYVRLVGENRSRQRRLARLPWPGDRDDRKALGKAAQGFCKGARDHSGFIQNEDLIVNMYNLVGRIEPVAVAEVLFSPVAAVIACRLVGGQPAVENTEATISTEGYPRQLGRPIPGAVINEGRDDSRFEVYRRTRTAQT